MTPEARMERKLTAIFSADVKGYSRLMGEDDAATVRTLTAHRTGPEIGIVNLTLAAQKSLLQVGRI